MSEYVVGNRIRCTGEFEDDLGAPIDPSSIHFKLKNPSGQITEHIPVKDAVGKYHVDVDVDAHGVWFYRFYSDGTGKAADERSFTVGDSEFS